MNRQTLSYGKVESLIKTNVLHCVRQWHSNRYETENLLHSVSFIRKIMVVYAVSRCNAEHAGPFRPQTTSGFVSWIAKAPWQNEPVAMMEFSSC